MVTARSECEAAGLDSNWRFWSWSRLPALLPARPPSNILAVRLPSPMPGPTIHTFTFSGQYRVENGDEGTSAAVNIQYPSLDIANICNFPIHIHI